jgi:DNA helicase-2/ATP-dependent DNA helicase PcrA
VVVGDASQSIYRWRGADYRNITRLKKDYPDLVEIRLERNYRSTQNILSAASSVINHNTNHPIIELWTEVGSGEKIGLIEAYSGSDEAAQVVEQINKLVAAGYTYNEIAILYRTNAQSRAFEEALIRSSIPYVLVGGTKFYERKEIKDLIAYARLFVNPQDNVSRTRAAKNGKRKLANYEAAIAAKVGNEMSATELLETILDATGYLNSLDAEVDEDLARIENIKELQNVASEFSTVTEFLENVALVQAEYYAGEKGGKPKDCVTLMTLHGAKGLEYRAVFLVGLEEGIFPHSRSLLDDEEMQEERRLMYVGVTRAKERLFISHARMRNLYGNNNPAIQSRFVQEILPELITVVSSNSGNGASRVRLVTDGSISAEYEDLFGVVSRNQDFVPLHTKKSGVRVDSLGDSTLDAFLSGDISVEELLNR